MPNRSFDLRRWKLSKSSESSQWLESFERGSVYLYIFTNHGYSTDNAMLNKRGERLEAQGNKEEVRF